MKTAAVPLLALLATGCAGPIAASPEARTARYLQSIRGRSAFEAVFVREMPKGGELHTHLSGAVYAENYLRWAAEDGLCARRSPPSIVDPPCDPARGDVSGAAIALDIPLYRALVDGFSMRNFPYATGSGHDHFFDTFERFDARRERYGDMLAEVVSRLARQNTRYVEVMQSLGVGGANRVGRDAGWSDDLAVMSTRVPESAVAAVVADARQRMDAQEARMRALLRCGQAGEDPGCGVTLRYLVQMIRTVPREEVFAQAVAAVAIIEADPRAVGLNLVAPEDDPVAVRDYRDHMRVIDHVTRHGTRVNVALHAGELTPSLVTPEVASDHVRLAVELAGARRIGHGTDIAWEYDAQGTLAMMASRGVAVEHCLRSADVILGVRGAEHPWGLYRDNGVAQVLCTDDEGVSRTDLSREYLLAAQSFGLGWTELKTLARNALTHSFLPGATLWERGSMNAACRSEVPGAERPGEACSRWLAGSERAREQWRLEASLRRFEAMW